MKKDNAQLKWSKTVNKVLIDLGARVEMLEDRLDVLQGMMAWHISYRDGGKLKTVRWEHKGKKK